MTERQTAIVSSVVAALVGVANAVFGWHLTTPDILGIVLPLIGLALSEAHIAHGKAGQVNVAATMSQVMESVLKAIHDAQGQGATGGPGPAGTGL